MSASASSGAIRPTDARFQEVYQLLQIRQNTLLHDENGRVKPPVNFEMEQAVDKYRSELLPAPEYRNMYMNWRRELILGKCAMRQEIKAKSAQDYQHAVGSTLLTDAKQVQKLVALFNRQQYPYISIGSHCGYRYRLRPNPNLLDPPEENIWYADPHEFAEDHIVGIDIPGGWRRTNESVDLSIHERTTGRTRKHRFSEETYFSASSSSSEDSSFDPENEWGFAFMQLGQVMNISVSEFDHEKSKSKEECQMFWEDSGYILGITTNGTDGKQPGRPGEVWLLYNFNPADLTGATIYLDERSDWGHLLGQNSGEGDGQRRGGFKIANSFSELDPDYQWNIDKYFDAVYQMTPTLLLKDPTLGFFIVRQPLGAQEMAKCAVAEERERAMYKQHDVKTGGDSSD